MACTINRRELLLGLGATGLAAGTGLGRAWAGDWAAVDAARPDRSREAPSLPVAIQRCESYDPQPLRAALDKAIELVGGLRTLVENKSVAIKINVTGGPGELAGLPGYRTYHIHPRLLAALCAALSDAGARRIVVLESQYSPKTPEEVLTGGGWDIAAVKAAGGQKVAFEDTRNRGRWPSYSRLKVPWGGFIFPALDVNPSYEKTDVFVSLSKLKDHVSAGTTASIKNLFGMTPTSLYGNDAPNEKSLSNRGDILHNGKRQVAAGVPAEIDHKLPAHWKHRVPRITADCLGARPVDLAVVDGIETNRGGEGPWCEKVEPLKPNLLLVGRNAVCTDAICAAAMGYDPQANHGQFPYPGDNHLKLLASVGVGCIDPKRIEVRGLPLEKAVFPFNPKRIPLETPTTRSYRVGVERAYA